jgi:pyruvate/2-oxoglutarate dehydrogenase complex dihydrolipoamide acyltransferase (E2) component
MNRRWAVVVGMLIGLLMIGQVVTLRYALAGGTSRNIGDARTAILAARAALAEATKSYQVETTSWNALNKMPLTETEHQMANLMAQSATTQKAVLNADRNCLKALQALLQQIDREHDKN